MDELEQVNKVDDMETKAIRRHAVGILEKRPWVWLRWSKVGGVWVLTPQISLEGAYELYRRFAKDSPYPLSFFIEGVNSFVTPKGVPVISVIVSLNMDTKSGEYIVKVPLAYGGQDGFIVQTTEDEERRMHGTAAALHKAIRNCIINYILLHHGADKIAEFVNEAIDHGRAAIVERDGSFRFITPEEVHGKAPAEKTTKKEGLPSSIAQQLSEIPPDKMNQYLLIYSEIIQKDPQVFSEREWTDFIKWTKMTVSRREINDLVQLAATLYRRENALSPDEPVDDREIFRYLSRNFVERGQRITELTLPEYHLIRQRIQNELFKTMQVVTPTEEESEEDLGDAVEITDDDFPF